MKHKSVQINGCNCQLLLYLYSHIVIQLCSIKMVHVLVTMLITVKHYYIQHKYLVCAQIQNESINIITS